MLEQLTEIKMFALISKIILLWLWNQYTAAFHYVIQEKPNKPVLVIVVFSKKKKEKTLFVRTAN